MTLHDRLAGDVARWRAAGYPHDTNPAIAEILDWARGADETNVRFLRAPQVHALETYWYLRLVAGTPLVPDLYRQLFPEVPDIMAALGLDHPELTRLALRTGGLDRLLREIREDDALVKQFRLEALRETLALDYPSYILALAMGAGKTLLIGAIVASEFAMAQEYPDARFVGNALVFAPGKTIIESLRELLAAPYDRILPPRFHKPFAASVKFTFTRDGEQDIPVIEGSLFNVVVTNTEKIRIQKEQVRKADLGPLLAPARLDEARQEVANRRLRKIASLPQLGVFSDEAHHTYGQSLDAELKKVRKTVDYLHAATDVICVVNTTGTPYFRRQPLRDVVIWYGLSQGIRDGILKDVSDSIHAYDFDEDTAAYLDYVLRDFFSTYRDVRLPDGASAKLAVYFPQTDDLAELRPAIEATLAGIGLSPALCLVNTSDAALTKPADVEAFNRLNDPRAPHRLILLVNKGTEGWNCPSLFACALARRLKSSNNFVLQASTRCLRQVPGNRARARIYLSKDNYGVLDRQLRETYGEEIADLNRATQLTRRARIVLRRLPIPPVSLTRVERTVRRAGLDGEVRLTRPAADARRRASVEVFTLDDRRGRRVLRSTSGTVEIERMPETSDVYAVASSLAQAYRLEALALIEQLKALYPGGEVPANHVNELAEQVEAQTRRYDVHEERVEVALALVKPEGFTEERDDQGRRIFTAEITYRADREPLLLRWDETKGWNRREYGFCYSPLDFDSRPEREFLERLLKELNVDFAEVEDVYYTGGVRDPAKTDFFIEYKDEDGRWRRYVPDFVIRKLPPRGGALGTGRVLIVEIKAEREKDHPVDGARGRKALAVRAWEDLNPERLKYEMIFTRTDTVTYDQMKPVFQFAEARELYLPIELDRERLAAWCRTWKVAKLELFGSVLTYDFRPDSDVDFLVTFQADAGWGLTADFAMKEELEAITGRRVDLVSRRAIERSENYLRRRNILRSARPIYVA